MAGAGFYILTSTAACTSSRFPSSSPAFASEPPTLIVTKLLLSCEVEDEDKHVGVDVYGLNASARFAWVLFVLETDYEISICRYEL
jgi:hypothetical protein